jgi:AraC-like DNA-binding protein
VRGLLAALEQWQQGAQDRLACEEAWCWPAACSSRATRRRAPAGHRGIGAGARQRLDAALAAPPSLAELAAEAGVSRFQLLRRFASATAARRTPG